MRFLRLRLGRSTFATLALLAGGCARPPHPAGPNLLLVTLDTVRADHLGCYGAAGAETPALDRLALEGTRFDSVTAAAPLTLPSHATLLSGLLPLHHGVHQNGGRAFPKEAATLATRLAAAGWETAAFVGAFVLDHRFGLDRGFAVYDDAIPRGPGVGSLEAERPGRAVVDGALAWLGRPRDKPFFAWVHLYDAHAPHEAAEPYRSRHPGDSYAAEIAEVDAQVGRLIDALRAAGALDRTLVVVVADHGEGLGEHDELTHGLLLYETTLRVPLLMRAPGVLPAGRRIAAPLGAADLAPTLVGLLGIPGAGERSDGRNLAGFIRGEAGTPPPAELVAETEYPRLFGWGALLAVRRGSEKLIDGPRPELYDLSADAAEAHDLRTERPRAAAALETVAAALRKQSENLVANQPAPLPDAETRARLQSLGYAAGAPAPSAETAPNPRERVRLLGEFDEARRRLRGGDAGGALPVLQELVRRDPGNPVFVGAMAEALRGSHQTEPAIAAFRAATTLAPLDPRAWYDLGVTLRDAGRLAEARGAFLEAIRLDPLDGAAQNGLGLVAALQGHGDEAREAFARAVALDPRDAVAANNLGNVLRQQGREAEAEAAYRAALATAPDYADALNGLGALEVARRRPEAAVPLLERAVTLAPEQAEIRLNLAVAYEVSGAHDQAVAAYRTFLRDAERDPQFAPQRAAVRARLKHLGAPPAPGP